MYVRILILCLPLCFSKPFDEKLKERTKEYANLFPNVGPNPDPEYGELWQGDIHVDVDFDDILESPLGSVMLKNRTWPGGKLYYDIDEDDFTQSQLDQIEAGVRDLETSTMVNGEKCIDLIRYYREEGGRFNYVRVWDRGSCSSAVGRTGTPQPLSLASGCFRHGTIMHEFLHALGIFHEQQRGDRDDYIDIIWDNIRPGYENNFNGRVENVTIDHLGTPYDYGSVMHYGPYGFAIDPEIPTIVPKDPESEIGQRTHLSDLDIERVQVLYGCLEPEESKYFRGLKMDDILIDE